MIYRLTYPNSIFGDAGSIFVRFNPIHSWYLLSVGIVCKLNKATSL
jgi:hypothetical protein